MTAPRAQPALPASTARSGRSPRWFGARPAVGVGPTGRVVAEDLSVLVKAEVALAKAEILAGVKPKAVGVGALVGAAAMAWLALQGLLITVALLLALVLPAWAAALIVSVVLLVAAGGAAVLGRKKLAAPVSLDTTERNVEEDVAWTKAHLPTR